MPESDRPLVGIGIASFVLGFLGLSLFLLPIVGIPVAIFGLCLSVAGIVTAYWRRTSLRWSLGGLALSLLALGQNVTIGRTPDPDVPSTRMSVSSPDRHFVSPPE